MISINPCFDVKMKNISVFFPQTTESQFEIDFFKTKMLFGSLSKYIYFKHDILLFQKNSLKKNLPKTKQIFMVNKAKKKILFKNCKCFFKKEKILIKAYFCWLVSPELKLLAWFQICKF